MTPLPYPPNTHSDEHPYGEHVWLPAIGTIRERHQSVVDRFLAAAATRLVGTVLLIDLIDNVILLADGDDYAANRIDLYTFILRPDARPNEWPSVEDVAAAVDALILEMQTPPAV
jgi:hypothetical protein